MDEAVATADVVSYATGSREPVAYGELLRPGAHLDLVGSFTLAMRECDDEVMHHGRVFINFEAAMEEARELVGTVQRGVLQRSDVAETLAELAAGTMEGRRSDDEITVFNLPKVHASFEKRPADILLVSFPKSVTTWLKALGFATVRRFVHSPLDGGHPLLSSNSHDCVKFIDTLGFLEDDDGNTAPRLLGTHLPYSLLPGRTTADDSGCRIVYVTRDAKLQ
ncbi:hypothetical protein BAE44_0021717 [Dichanthelium oligosanthes]|uniref:Sulfotransferase n=1 Tax=Dichanthelium oligosanthes TaxID=888268 RepID=A0A1E5UWT8_9POAL|nr:hypothetical protein BAE44_0021717 [Dichanthelium oligosanthes]